MTIARPPSASPRPEVDAYRIALDALGRRRPGGLSPCGTRAAYRRHLNHGELTCRPCCNAEAAYRRALRNGHERTPRT